MICEKCKKRMKCIDSRHKDPYVRRRYECKCGERYTTIETKWDPCGGAYGKAICLASDILANPKTGIELIEKIESVDRFLRTVGKMFGLKNE